MNKRHYEHTLPNIRGSLSNTYAETLRVILSNQRNDFHFYTKFFHLLLYFLAA